MLDLIPKLSLSILFVFLYLEKISYLISLINLSSYNFFILPSKVIFSTPPIGLFPFYFLTEAYVGYKYNFFPSFSDFDPDVK